MLGAVRLVVRPVRRCELQCKHVHRQVPVTAPTLRAPRCKSRGEGAGLAGGASEAGARVGLADAASADLAGGAGLGGAAGRLRAYLGPSAATTCTAAVCGTAAATAAAAAGRPVAAVVASTSEHALEAAVCRVPVAREAAGAQGGAHLRADGAAGAARVATDATNKVQLHGGRGAGDRGVKGLAQGWQTGSTSSSAHAGFQADQAGRGTAGASKEQKQALMRCHGRCKVPAGPHLVAANGAGGVWGIVVTTICRSIRLTTADHLCCIIAWRVLDGWPRGKRLGALSK